LGYEYGISKMLKKIFQSFKGITFFCKPISNDVCYQGWDVYGQKWVIKTENGQQLWAMVQNKVICNSGYYKPHRKFYF